MPHRDYLDIRSAEPPLAKFSAELADYESGRHRPGDFRANPARSWPTGKAPAGRVPGHADAVRPRRRGRRRASSPW